MDLPVGLRNYDTYTFIVPATFKLLHKTMLIDPPATPIRVVDEGSKYLFVAKRKIRPVLVLRNSYYQYSMRQKWHFVCYLQPSSYRGRYVNIDVYCEGDDIKFLNSTCAVVGKFKILKHPQLFVDANGCLNYTGPSGAYLQLSTQLKAYASQY